MVVETEGSGEGGGESERGETRCADLAVAGGVSGNEG